MNTSDELRELEKNLPDGSAIAKLRNFDAAVEKSREQLAAAEFMVATRGAKVYWFDLPQALLPTSDEVKALIRSSIERRLAAARAELVRAAAEEANAILRELDAPMMKDLGT